jgi:Xaa-Pro aminopeptidase
MLTGEVSRFYASGLRTSAGVVLLTERENVFITDGRYIRAAKETLYGSFRIEETTVQRKYSTIINDIIPRAKRLGVESDILTVKAAEGWKKAFSDLGNKSLKLIPAEEKLHSMRAVKDRLEIAAMQEAQRISEMVFGEILTLLRQGVTEREICAEIICRLIKNGGDKPSFDPIVASGPNSGKPHAQTTDRVIGHGEFVMIDMGCVCNGYCSDMTRTVAVGGASAEMREIYNLVLKAQKAGIAAARAGIRGKEIDAAARTVIAGAGYGEYFGHGFGHGIGLKIHESPNANPSETTIMPAGAIISAEPGIYLPGKFGVRIEDVVRLTETGFENFTKVPKELLII